MFDIAIIRVQLQCSLQTLLALPESLKLLCLQEKALLEPGLLVQTVELDSFLIPFHSGHVHFLSLMFLLLVGLVSWLELTGAR